MARHTALFLCTLLVAGCAADPQPAPAPKAHVDQPIAVPRESAKTAEPEPLPVIHVVGKGGDSASVSSETDEARAARIRELEAQAAAPRSAADHAAEARAAAASRARSERETADAARAQQAVEAQERAKTDQDAKARKAQELEDAKRARQQAADDRAAERITKGQKP